MSIEISKITQQFFEAIQSIDNKKYKGPFENGRKLFINEGSC